MTRPSLMVVWNVAALDSKNRDERRRGDRTYAVRLSANVDSSAKAIFSLSHTLLGTPVCVILVTDALRARG